MQTDKITKWGIRPNSPRQFYLTRQKSVRLNVNWLVQRSPGCCIRCNAMYWKAIGLQLPHEELKYSGMPSILEQWKTRPWLWYDPLQSVERARGSNISPRKYRVPWDLSFPVLPRLPSCTEWLPGRAFLSTPSAATAPFAWWRLGCNLAMTFMRLCGPRCAGLGRRLAFSSGTCPLFSSSVGVEGSAWFWQGPVLHAHSWISSMDTERKGSNHLQLDRIASSGLSCSLCCGARRDWSVGNDSSCAPRYFT